MRNIIKIYIFIIFLGIIVNTVFAATANLSWNANTEPDLAGYKVYYGTSVRTSPCPPGGYPNSVNAGNVTSFAVPNLTDGATYFFSITAYDTAGNESCFSGEVSKTIPTPTPTSTATSISTSTNTVPSIGSGGGGGGGSVLTTATSVSTLTATSTGTLSSTTTPTSTVKFSLQQRVQTTAKISVRNAGSLTGVSLGSQNSGVFGAVIGGPIQSGGYTWWQINYDNSPDGWSAENWLIASTVSAPTTIQTTTQTTTQTATTSAVSTTVSTNQSFVIGQRVRTTANLNVRNSASLTASNLGTQYSGSKGTIIGGPVSSGGYIWWQINYDNSPDGWSAGNWLTADSSVAPTTSQTITQTITSSTVSKFTLNQRIKTTANLNVRSAASLSASRLGVQYINSQGTVISGPVQADGYIWWKINYDLSPDGWSVENWLTSF